MALPLGLSDIARRLESGYYRQPAAVLHDIQTIHANAATFNAEGSEIIEVAEGDCLSPCVRFDVSPAAWSITVSILPLHVDFIPS